MKKKTIIQNTAESKGQSLKVTGEIVDAFLEQIKTALINGDSVDFKGFGKFKVVNRAEKKGRNPRTGEEIIIPAYKIPRVAFLFKRRAFLYFNDDNRRGSRYGRQKFLTGNSGRVICRRRRFGKSQRN